MKRVDLYEMYKAPGTHQPPSLSALKNDTMYPNMNSIEYRNKSILIDKVPARIPPFFETFDVNDNETVILGANTYNDRIWAGTLWGYDKFTDISGNINGKELFCLNFDAPITNLRFFESSMVSLIFSCRMYITNYGELKKKNILFSQFQILVTDANGSIQMWSTQSAARNQNGYSLYSISKKAEHVGLILSLDVLSSGENGLKAITGSSDSCIKIWNVGPCDLVSEKTYRYAHADAVTDIASKPDSESCFLTSSRDKSISMWDYRLATPVVNYYEGDFPYNTISWSTDLAQILAGNERGEIHVFDSRNLKTIFQQIQGFSHKPIHKIKVNCNNDNLVAVLGQSKVVKVFDMKNDFKLVYENDSAIDYVRDVHWCRDNSDSFYSIGWNKTAAVHSVIPS